MSDDAYEWEQDNRLPISVVLAIFVYGVNKDGEPRVMCGFHDEQGVVSLPKAPLTKDKCAPEVVVDLITKYIKKDISILEVTPVGFFDPIDSKENREVLLAYKVYIVPGTPVLSSLEFKDYEELRIVDSRTDKNSLRVFRAASIAS